MAMITLGPGSGYRPEGRRWREMQAIPQAKSPEGFVDPHVGEPLSRLVEIGPAAKGRGTRSRARAGTCLWHGAVRRRSAAWTTKTCSKRS